MARDMEAWEIARAVTVMFPTAKLQGEGRFKVVFRLDSNRVLKVSKTALGQKMERKEYDRKDFPKDLVPWTRFLSTRVQIQERLEQGPVPPRELKRLKKAFKKIGVCDVRPANIGFSKDGKFKVLDWLPSGWKKRVHENNRKVPKKSP